jgi:hypothetical protein
MVASEVWVTSEKGSEIGSGRARLLNVRWKEKEIARTIAGKIHFGTRHNESILVLPHIVRYLADLPVSILVIKEWERHLEDLEKELQEGNKTPEEEENLRRSIGETTNHLKLFRE